MNKIIDFHSVNDRIWFDKIICYLKSKYTLVSIEALLEFYEGNCDFNDSFHITIDDGDKSFYDIIFPVLRKHQVPASIYVSPKICIDESNFWFQEVDGFNQFELKKIIADILGIPLKRLIKFNSYSLLKVFKISQIHEIINRYRQLTKIPKKSCQNMSVNNLIEVRRSGLVTIGAHTINHPILSNEDDATSKYEINESVDELSNLLNSKIKYFAYPNGIPDLDFSEREKSYLRGSGIQLAFTTVPNSLSPTNDTLSVPRYAISDNESMSFFKIKMLLGSHWELFKQLRLNGEMRERKALSRINLINKVVRQE